MKWLPSAFCIATLCALTLFFFAPEAFAQKVGIASIRGGTRVAVPQSAGGVGLRLVEEVEPNNTMDAAQTLQGASPITLNGNAEVTDEGDLVITFNDGSSDDIEDLFIIETTQEGLNIKLNGFSADCDLYLINEAGDMVIDASLNIGTDDEEVDAPNLAAGIYFIGISIYDPDPGSSNTTAYTLTVTGTVATAIEVGDGVPASFALGQNYPNPFNPETRIQYDLPANASVRLDIFNLVGQKVKTLVHEGHAAGTYTVTWDGLTDAGTEAATGVYIYRLQAGTFMQARTLVLLR